MNTLLERWCESRPGIGYSAGARESPAGLVAWGALLRPVDRQCAEQQRQLIENVSTNASLWPVVRKGLFLPDAAKTRELAPFSRSIFRTMRRRWFTGSRCRMEGTDAGYGVAGHSGTFSRLAQQDVQIAAFAIAPQGTALRLQLELEHAK